MLYCAEYIYYTYKPLRQQIMDFNKLLLFDKIVITVSD